MTFDAFYAAYEEHRINERNALIHFRITTRGDTSVENCHPFALDNGALIHNGTMSGLGKIGTGPSDTQLFAGMIRDLTDEQLIRMQPIFEEFLEYNKVAVLMPERFIIFNQKDWIVEDDIHYSNDGYRENSWYCSTGTYSRKQRVVGGKDEVVGNDERPDFDELAAQYQDFLIEADAQIGSYDGDTWTKYGFRWSSSIWLHINDEHEDAWLFHRAQMLVGEDLDDLVFDDIETMTNGEMHSGWLDEQAIPLLNRITIDNIQYVREQYDKACVKLEARLSTTTTATGQELKKCA